MEQNRVPVTSEKSRDPSPNKVTSPRVKRKTVSDEWSRFGKIALWERKGADSLPFVNVERVCASGFGDSSAVDHLLMLIAASCPRELQSLNEHMNAKNWSEACLTAHSIKGAASNLGFMRLEGHAGELEELLEGVPAGDVNGRLITKAQELYSEIEQDTIEVLEYAVCVT